MCFLTALRPFLSTPLPSRVSVAFLISSNESPGEGIDSTALPPPEIKKRTRSFSPAVPRIDITSLAALTLLSSGTGCPQRIKPNLLNFLSGLEFDMTMPPVSLSPNTSSTPSAMAEAALPKAIA